MNNEAVDKGIDASVKVEVPAFLEKCRDDRQSSEKEPEFIKNY